jgi:hypothetical protein
MWIRIKEKLLNTRHLAEISLHVRKMNSGLQMFEVQAKPARKENAPTVLCELDSRDDAQDILVKIGEAIAADEKEYVMV